jgi:hypothetical protein
MRAAILSRRCCGDARVCALLRKLCEQGHPISHTWFGIVGDSAKRGLNGGGPLHAGVRAREDPVGPAERHRADGRFGGVVREADPRDGWKEKSKPARS